MSMFLKLTEITRKWEAKGVNDAEGSYLRTDRIELPPLKSSVMVNIDRALTISANKDGDTCILFGELEESYCSVVVTETPEEIMARIK